MKTLQKPSLGNQRIIKSKAKSIENFEDLYDERLQDIYWTERALLKAIPKSGPKIKKMKN